LVLGQDQGFSEDPTQAVEELIEAPNQSSEALTLPPLIPLKKASPRHIPLLYLHCNLCLFILYLALGLGVEMKP
jgi:hypothetical protein